MNLLDLLTTFDGRIGRRDYWVKGMGSITCYSALVYAALVTILFFDPQAVLISLALVAYSFAVFMLFAVTAKRLHDLGRSGWWSLLLVTPLFGLAFWLWVGCATGNQVANDYGKSTEPISNWNHGEGEGFPRHGRG